MRNETDFLILGSGIAACSAAAEIRKYRPKDHIMMVTAQKQLPYIRPLLTKASLKYIEESALCFVDDKWFHENNIEYVSDSRILSLFLEQHCIETTRGNVFYKKCVYALGGEANIPPIVGSTLDGVFPVRTLENMWAIKRRLLKTEHVVIIGGGIIGVEIGIMLQKYGITSVILEAQEYLLPQVLDRESANEFRNRIVGCHVETGVSIQAIEGKTSVSSVLLADGRYFPCTLVIISCSITPNDAIARKAGLETHRGVMVSDWMQTSDSDVFACGDCVASKPGVPALWKIAMEQGRIAGRNACGVNERFVAKSYPVLFYSENTSLFAQGQVNVTSNTDIHIVTERGTRPQHFLISQRPKDYYRRLVYRGERLIGAALIGDLSDASSIRVQLAEE